MLWYFRRALRPQVANQDVDYYAQAAVDHLSQCAQFEAKRQNCSFTAFGAFEKLSQIRVTRDYLRQNPPVFFKNSNELPGDTAEPSVVLVSLANKKDLLDDDDGHRLLFIIACGDVRQLQACNGESLSEE